ncbi:MAG: ASKHA domain-containing protein [Desulfobacteraceae bacterium]|nr:ASKHA domain-containing protein [Desulfobacteraceae bacterium]
MGKCVNHPDRETAFLCMKHNVYMCEDCLHCRDPKIHCKFRTSCPIWFMEKQAAREASDRAEADKAALFKVMFLPDQKEIMAPEGATLLEAAVAAEVPLNASCNGKGACGKCKLVLESGVVEGPDSPLLSPAEKGKNYILACQKTVHSHVTVKIPEETIEKKMKIAGMGQTATDRMKGLVPEITPMLKNMPLTLQPPTLDDAVSDFDRLFRGLAKAGCDTSRMTTGLSVMRELAAAMRDDNWKVTASVVKKRYSSEIVRVIPGTNGIRSLGLAIDIGTTSIVVYLVDMADGSVLAATSSHNRQAACGDDVINRIICAEKDGVKKLSRMGLATINGLINEAVDSAGVSRDAIDNVALAGNTTMTHLILEIEPRHIRREPYVPSVSAFPVLRAGDIGLGVNPIAAVFVMPGPASYVGGDIVSGLIFTGLHRREGITLFIDVGTNGEIVLGNRDWLLTASCSAGPAFEGGGVRWGMRAEDGAIEKVTIDPVTWAATVSVVGDVPARGICGSGMIDLISELFLKGVIQANGKFSATAPHPRMVKQGDEPAYILVFEEETGVDQDIVFLESDIGNIIRSKGSVYAGFQVLLDQAGLDFSSIDQVIIAGGFGQFLDLDKAIIIGLLPDIDKAKFQYVGNSAIAGAYMALLSEPFRKEALDVCNRMTYVDFSTNNQFMEAFTSSLFLPHTNLLAFPSVMALMANMKTTSG